MAAYPISPRHARMLMEVALQDQAEAAAAAAAEAGQVAGGGRARRVLPYAVALAAVLSVDSPFVHIDSLGGGEGKDGEGKGGKEGGEEGGEEDEEGGGEEAAARRAERQRQREAAKQRRAAAREAHAQFRVADSDALR